MAAEEVKRDLQVIKNFLDELVTSTQSSSFEMERLKKVLDSLLVGAGSVAGGPDNLVKGLKNVINSADTAAERVLRLNNLIDETFRTRQVFNRFGSPEVGGRQLGPPAFQRIDETPFRATPFTASELGERIGAPPSPEILEAWVKDISWLENNLVETDSVTKKVTSSTSAWIARLEELSVTLEGRLRFATEGASGFQEIPGGAGAPFREQPFTSAELGARIEGVTAFPDKGGYDDWIQSLARLDMELEQAADAERTLEEGIDPTAKQLDVQAGAADQSAIALAKLNERGRSLTKSFRKLADDPFFVQSLPGGQVAVKNVTQELKKMGLSLDSVKSITQDASRGITRYNASIIDQNGVVKSATIVTDKWGNILKSTQKNFRSFASAIQRNVLEVIKWTVAIGLVYGTMRKFQEILEQSIEIQSKLADVQVVLGSSAENLNEIFNSAAIVAREMGTELIGVVEGYVLALRAAGKYTDETERVQKATQLLRDSMILAKLSGIEQALALDTLVGALSQTGRELDQGVELLDKWVAVAKEANVSIGTLAESFAITATAAGNVGVDLDKLNGIIAAVAEVTTLSATEAGNAVRAFISGFQTAEAEKALSRYGIAVRDAGGELLSFIDILETIVERQGLGIISDRDVARISEAIGGGARRGAQVNALIESYSRVLELSAVSANASGDAQEALGIKLETVETAITNLGNAFTEFSHSLGERGGFLDAMAGAIELLTTIVDGVKSLVEILGPATKAIGAFAAAWLLIGGIGPLKGLRQGMGIGGGSIAMGWQGATLLTRAQRRLPQQLQGIPRALGAGLSSQALARGAGGIGIGLLGAMASGKTELDEIGSSIAGGIAGTLVAGPVGGLIGSIIGQAFVNELRSSPGEIQEAFRAAQTGKFAVVAKPEDEEVTEQAVQSRIDNLIESALGPILGGFGADIKFGNLLRRGTFLGGRRGPIEEFIGEGELEPEELQRQAKRLLLEALSGALTGDEIIQIFGGEIGVLLLSVPPEIRDEAKEWVEKINAEIAKQLEEAKIDIENVLAGTRVGKQLAETQRGVRPAVTAVGEERIEQLRIESIRGGGVSVSALRELRKELPQLANQVGVIFQALGGDEERLSDITEETITNIDALTLAYLKFGNESTAVILDTANNILVLRGELDEFESAKEATPVLRRIKELEKALREFIITSQKGVIFKEFDIPPIIEISEEALAQMDEIIAEAFSRSEAFMDALGLDEIQRDKIRQTYREAVFGIDKEFQALEEAVPLNILQDILRERGLLDKKDQPLRVITPDIPSERAPEIRQRIKMFEQILSTIPGYELDPETLGVVFSDFVTDVLHGDNLAIQLALRDLIQVSEDQLEGIFNIPEGMSAFIPFTAAMNLPGARGGLADYDFSQLEDAEERSAQDIVAEITTVKEAIMGGEMPIQAGFAKIEELWAELQVMRDRGEEIPTIPRLAEDVREGVGVQRLDRETWEAINAIGPSTIGVDITNNIEIEVPVYIRGDVIQREVRRFLERDFSQTVSRLGGGSTPNLSYK